MSLPTLSPLPFAAALFALVAAPHGSAAQPQASQHGAVSQTVNTTRITVEYDRPSARGRAIFGEILDYDVVWTPGANRATWMEVSQDVTVEGVHLPAGRYGVWTVPHDDGPWEVLFVTEWDTHHSYFPFETEAARVAAVPEPAEHMETLAFYFPVVGPYDTVLKLHWGDVAVPVRIQVPRN